MTKCCRKEPSEQVSKGSYNSQSSVSNYPVLQFPYVPLLLHLKIMGAGLNSFAIPLANCPRSTIPQYLSQGMAYLWLG